MNLDLFAATEVASPAEYREAIDTWLAEGKGAGRLQHESSSEVYDHMWSALTSWAVGNGIRLADISATDLGTYLGSRGGTNELTARYARRLLRLVDGVLASHARAHDLPLNPAATKLMAQRPDIRYAGGVRPNRRKFPPPTVVPRDATSECQFRPPWSSSWMIIVGRKLGV